MAMCVCICAGRGDALNRRQSHVEHWPSLSCRNAQLAQHCREKTQSFQGENDIKVTLVQSGRQYRNTSSYYTLLYCAVQVMHFLLNKLKVYGHPVWSKSIGAIFPTAFAHLVSLCHILVILVIFQIFHYYYICCGRP